MTNNKLLLVIRAIILLHRDRIYNGDIKHSKLNVTNMVELVKPQITSTVLGGGDNNTTMELIELLNGMSADIEQYSSNIIIESLNVILSTKKELLDSTTESINKEMKAMDALIYINATNSILMDYVNESKLKKIISRASFMVNSGDYDGKNLMTVATELKDTLGTLTDGFNGKKKDSAIMEEIDVDKLEDIYRAIDNAKKILDVRGRMITGFKEFNKATQGGLRRGEQVMINALQHSYKSSMVRTIFIQLAMFNEPYLFDENKKPLALYLSLEDNMDVIIKFMYEYLWYEKHDSKPDLINTDTKTMGVYIKTILRSRGFHVKFLRIKPDNWSFQGLTSLLDRYEALGYEVIYVLIDYLSKIPTTGCIRTGPMGTDVRDLFNRVRNYCAEKNILNITPHQLSSDAKQLFRHNLPPTQFVKNLVGKGYTSESRQLDQVIDLEFYIHIIEYNGKPVLTVQRGKHRIPDIIPNKKDLYFMLPFPYLRPLPSNLDTEDNKVINVETDDSSAFDF